VPNLVNQMIVRELADDLRDAEGMVLVSFAGLDVKETEKLRGNLAGKGARFRMVRNRLARRVLAERGLDFAGGSALLGNTAIAYGSAEEAIGAAKVLTDKDVKKAGKVKIQGGMLEGTVLDAAAAEALADVPDRDTLRAQLLGVISGPARALATVVNAVPAAVARVIQARADELAKSEG